tara:strand:+ start:652 stop:906 length:255 start_codon:yes stop_codon:yes gene_type:complete
MTWPQFVTWRALWELSPWGEDRADLRQAVAISYHLQTLAELDEPPPDITYPYFGESEPETQIDLAASLDMLNAQRAARNGIQGN